MADRLSLGYSGSPGPDSIEGVAIGLVLRNARRVHRDEEPGVPQSLRAPAPSVFPVKTDISQFETDISQFTASMLVHPGEIRRLPLDRHCDSGVSSQFRRGSNAQPLYDTPLDPWIAAVNQG